MPFLQRVGSLANRATEKLFGREPARRIQSAQNDKMPVEMTRSTFLKGEGR
jgi:hypothetical protein